MDGISPDDFENSPPPPRFLYKYLAAERIGNVLVDGTVRFTPLLNTNDTFEVRSTFDKLLGPKALSTLADFMKPKLSKEAVLQRLSETLKELNLDYLPSENVKKFLEQQYGGIPLERILQDFTNLTVDNLLVPYANNPKTINNLLEQMGRDLHCFSLSERMDNALMWAHYADDHAGFVVAFDTEHAWFHHRVDPEKTRLQKVVYFDGKLDEVFDNPQAAFISKMSDWAYEREWRIYIKNGEAHLTVGSSEEPIHLLKFPPEAVNRIILGKKTRPEDADCIRKAVADRYPHAPVVRAVPNRETHTYDEVLV